MNLYQLGSSRAFIETSSWGNSKEKISHILLPHLHLLVYFLVFRAKKLISEFLGLKTCLGLIFPCVTWILLGPAWASLLQIDYKSRLIASGIVWKPQTNHTWHREIFFQPRNAVKIRMESFKPCVISLIMTKTLRGPRLKFLSRT